jgi:hypothetical protein
LTSLPTLSVERTAASGARLQIQALVPPSLFSAFAKSHSPGLRGEKRTGTILGMTLKDIEQEALGLSERERAELILSLMSTLVAPGADIEDEEVFRRDAELESGRVEPLLHEEFVRRVREKRGR